jgi:mannose-1-phosphate guanylyltransferase
MTDKILNKCLILSAGYGSRLKPLTDLLPKPLSPIGEHTLFQNTMFQVVAAGFEFISINTFHLPDLMEQAAQASQKNFGFKSLTISREAPDILGTGGALVALSQWWGDESIVVYNGDILTNISLETLRDLHLKSDHIATLVTIPTPPIDGGRAIWINSEGAVKYICKIEDLPSQEIGLTAVGFAGVYATSAKLKDHLPVNISYFDIVEAFINAMKRGYTIGTMQHQGYWSDIGTPKRLWQANLHLVNNPHIFKLLEPDFISSNSYLFTSSLGENSFVSRSASVHKSARLKNSVVFSGSQVLENERLENHIRGVSLDLAF